MDNIRKYREEIDAIDQQIIDLLTQRFKQVREISRYKKEHGLKALGQNRWQSVLNSKLELAKTNELDPKMVEEIYNIIHKYAIQIQKTDLAA